MTAVDGLVQAGTTDIKETILDAIGMAGGTTRLANEGGVQVTRSGQKPLKVDLKKLRKETDPEKVFILQAGDSIFVPESTF